MTATRTKPGILVPILLVLGLAGVAGAIEVTNRAGRLLGANNQPVFLGDGDNRFLVGADGQSRARQCTEPVMRSRRCGDIKVVAINAETMSFIARNIKLAWESGRPSVLHRESANARHKRDKVCGAAVFTKTYPNGSCDEFPFATSREGGQNARAEEVHPDEQNCQGGTVARAYENLQIDQGDEYLVVIVHPDAIATAPWAGQEVRVGLC